MVSDSKGSHPLPRSANFHPDSRQSPEDELLDPDLRYDSEPRRKISLASLSPHSRTQQRPASNEATTPTSDQADLTGAEAQPSEDDAVDSAASTNQAKKPLVKRVRIPIACVTCRHKKIKCDGQVPCSHCEKHRAECVYPAANKPISHEYVEALESRLRSTESHLLKLLAHGLQPSGSTDAADTNPHPPHTSICTSSLTVDDNPFGCSPQGHQDPIATELHLAEQQPLIKDHAIDLVKAIMGKLKIDSNGSARHLSPLHSLQTGPHASSDEAGPAGQTPNPETTATLPKPSAPTAIPAIIPPKVAETLFKAYFNNVHTFLPIFSRLSLQGFSSEHPSQAMPPFLLMAIYTVASCYVGDRELKGLTIGRNSKPHQVLYDRTRAMLDAHLGVPSLSTIQGLLLMAYYQLIELQPENLYRSRMYLQIAVRMAVDLGLSRETSAHCQKSRSDHIDFDVPGIEVFSASSLQSGTPLSKFMDTTLNAQHDRAVQQERQLAWLACYSLDGMLSGILGQDPCSPEIHENAWQLFQGIKSTVAVDSDLSSTLAFWYLHLELVRIYRRICELNKDQNNSSLQPAHLHQRIQSLDRALDEWRVSLPEHLIFVRDEYSVLGPRPDDANLPSYYTLYLHRYYYSLRLLLYRPLIYSKAHRGTLSDHRSALSNCVRAAARLTQLGQIIYHNYDWPWQGCGFFGYHMLLAAEIHLYLMTEAMELAVRSYVESPQVTNLHHQGSTLETAESQELSGQPPLMDIDVLPNPVHFGHHFSSVLPTTTPATMTVPESLVSTMSNAFGNVVESAIPLGGVNASLQSESNEGHPPSEIPDVDVFTYPHADPRCNKTRRK
ncbi:hypothetical protein BGW38_000107 [Lunasporangiospora selenospora]|uniref:Zn(2)-C6 fungal-type domain-containing protein n=1 Tax=Lunasporangiospora selenospora TaxID=979761 RepID=A0A9P6KF79_9FUNG|nr:hypothetical protein BGW38_000107 [Lunasporangiospora selenospora]